MTSRNALAAGALLAAAFGATSSPAFAAGELISRATGTDGAPLSDGVLVTATRDGRFVLFSGPYNEAVSAEPDDRRTLFVRDRKTGTTTPVLRADGEVGVVWANDGGYALPKWTGLDISADGTKVLFSGPKPAGGEGKALYVRDLAAKTTAVVSILPSGETAAEPVGAARFVDGGAGIMFGAKPAGGAPSTYTRVLAAGTTELFTAGVAPDSITADGETITWTRPLLPAPRPASSVTETNWPAAYEGTASGYLHKGGPRIVTMRTKLVEHANAPGRYCYDSSVGFERQRATGLSINDTGNALAQHYAGYTTDYTAYGEGSYTSVRRPDGAWPDFNGSSPGYRAPGVSLIDLGETGTTHLFLRGPHDSSFLGSSIEAHGEAELPPIGDPITTPYDRNSAVLGGRLFAGDTGIVVTEAHRPDYTAPATRTVVAYDPVTPGTAPAATTPAKGPGEIVDDPSLTADVSWASCPELVVGAPAEYATVRYNTPFATSRPAGTVTTVWPVSTRERVLRGVEKTTLTVKTLGFTTWSKVIPGSDSNGRPTAPTTVELPKPWLLWPQTLTIDTELQTVGGVPVKHVVQTRSWQAWK